MAILDDIKLALRVKTSTYDSDISDLIETAKLDLSVGGVVVIEETDALTKQAIKLYCKANYGYDENIDKFQKAYESLKYSMALCGDYNEVKP